MSVKPWGGLPAAMILAGLILALGASAAEPSSATDHPVRLLAIEEVEHAGAPALQVRAAGPFSFTSYQASQRSVVADLTGVVAEPAAEKRSAGVSWIAGYRLLPFQNASGRSVLRLDLTLARDCAVRLTQPTPSSLLFACPETAAEAAAAAPAPASGAPARVRRVAVNDEGKRVIVRIQADAPLGYETLTLSGPVRLVVDLPHSILLSRRRQLPVNATAVTGVRVAQFKAAPPVTRVVVDLQKMIPYEIESTPTGLQVILLPDGPLAARPGAPVEPTSSKAKKEASVSARDESPQPRSLPAPASRPPVEAVSEARPAEPQEDSRPAPVMVASLAPTLPTSSSAGETKIEAQPVEAEPEPVEMARNAAAPTAQQPPVPTQQRQPAGQAPATELGLGLRRAPAEYTGEPISVNLKDVDLKDFFRLIHEISGLNIVVDPNVSGTVTLVLIDVPWDQALDIVLRNNGLASTLEGNVLRIATRETLRDEQQAEAELRQARQEAVEPVMVTRQLSYAQAADLEPTLRRFLSPQGELIRDERTNTLIIRDIPSVIPAVDNLIEQLDRKSLQVEIEARVVSASRAFARAIGSQLAFSAATGSRRSVVGGALGPSGFESTTPVPPPLVASEGAEGEQPLVTNFPIAATSAILFGNRWDDVALDVILQAAESRNIAKVLSRPRLITQNNIEADVKQGSRIPVQTVVNNTISTQFLDVVLELTVKPQITAEGTVFLDIHIENTSIDPGIERINGIPALSTQSTTTQVLVDDGGTVVIGGVMVTNNSTNIQQVPLLGSIPIIGHLFKSTQVSTSTSELLFFITPRIIEG